MATRDTSEFGKLNLKTLVSNFIEAGINGDGATAGDLLFKASNGNIGDFKTVAATLHFDDSASTLSFTPRVKIVGLITPTDADNAATKGYVDNHKAQQLVTMTGNNFVIKATNGAEAWTTENLLSGFIIRTTTSDATDTLPTAVEMIAAIPNAEVGSGINLVVHKKGTHKVIFTSNTTGGANGFFVIGGDSGNSAQTDIAPVLNNLRSTTLKIIVTNITPGQLRCELIMISDR